MVDCADCDGQPTYDATWVFSDIPQHWAGGSIMLTGAGFSVDKMTLQLIGVTFGEQQQALDGNWNNPACLCDAGDQFPSGNNGDGDDLVYRFNILPGDINRDLQVTFDDFLIVSGNFGAFEEVLAVDGDVNGNGEVGFLDFLALFANFNLSLVDPSCSCGAAQQSGGSTWPDQTEVLARFLQLADAGISGGRLAIEFHMLKIIWEHADAKAWSLLEKELIAYFKPLESSYRELTKEIDAFFASEG